MSIMIIMFWCQTQKMYAKINFAQIPKKKKKIAKDPNPYPYYELLLVF